MDVASAVLYIVTILSVGVLFLSVAFEARRSSTSLRPRRLVELSLDELKRVRSGGAVFLMHVAIILGIGLTIVASLLYPVLDELPLLRVLELGVSVPVVAGLLAAFGWRVDRFRQSKSVERGLEGLPKGFSSASSKLQLILMVAILMTTVELLLQWVPYLGTSSLLLGVGRNLLIAYYYGRPSANLINGFDRPLSSVRLPFKLEDVLSGATDPSEVKTGVSKASEFEPYQKLSYDSCVEIGACEAACPATAAGRPLSPRVLVRKLSLVAATAGGAEVELSRTIPDDELWSCTSCGACVSSCPVSVKHLDLIYDLRRSVVGLGRLDKEKNTMLQNLAQSQNPYGFSQGTRADWSRDLGVDTVDTNPDAEYVYWVGCVSSFDQRAQRIAVSMVKILKRAGVSFAILGGLESCNGDPARRLGEEGRFQELAYHNIEVMRSHKVKRIITTCPHCLNTLKNEYPQFGGSFEVIHHTQLISDLVKAGKLPFAKEKASEVSTTLHDACYASRYNSIFDEPRSAVRASGAHVHEMKRRGESTFCCGAGGSNYWYNVPQRRSIASIRTEEAAGTGASTIATECPFCLSMFDDSTKVAGVAMEVKDVAEIVAESLS